MGTRRTPGWCQSMLRGWGLENQKTSLEKVTCELTKQQGVGGDWKEECGKCHVAKCIHPCGRASREAWLGHRVLARAKLVGLGQPQLLRVLHVPTTL